MSADNDRTSGLRRTRRNLVKAAAGLIAGVAALKPVSRAHAQAQTDSIQVPSGGGCFRRGTRVLTERGWRRIETLAPGDRLVARFGGLQAIKHVEHFMADADTGVVRVARSALDHNVPSDDLWLTASHAVHLEGVLIPIGNLVNGVTITAEESQGEFFHVELATHDVIEAEGTSCETLRLDGQQACAPILAYAGGRAEFTSRLRSAAAVVIDRRTHLDVIRDRVEARC